MNNIDKKLKELENLLVFKNDKEREQFRVNSFQLAMLATISDYMKKNNISRKKLSKRIKLSEEYLSDIFACEQELTIELLYKFECALNSKFALSIEGIK